MFDNKLKFKSRLRRTAGNLCIRSLRLLHCSNRKSILALDRYKNKYSQKRWESKGSGEPPLPLAGSRDSVPRGFWGNAPTLNKKFFKEQNLHDSAPFLVF